MRFENLIFEVKDGLAHLTLNRPKAANSLNRDLTRELLETATICAEDSAIRAVLLTGAGRFFSAGGDLKNFVAAKDQIPKMVFETANTLHAAISKFARMNAPIVAAVNGPAAGAGMSLVCMTDIAIAAESALPWHTPQPVLRPTGAPPTFCRALSACGVPRN
jgi:2-(1,2-epoxy-1,2-dihydrophenyl)acetyl-CoA isomerase